jgi:hypothetical protein
MPDCTCTHCVSACKRVPGIPTPLEALRAIRAGLADDLMMVYRERDKRGWKWGRHEWPILMPVSEPPEYARAEVAKHYRNEWFKAGGRCVFLNVDERCEIHDSGFKPAECRASMLCENNRDKRHENIAALWDTTVGRLVIGIWSNIRNPNRRRRE